MKALSWSLSAVFGLLVAGLAFIHFSPGYGMYMVKSGSMEPAICTGDLIVTGPVRCPLSGEIGPGAIVAYELDGETVTHRVLIIQDDNTLVTKGDAAEDPDAKPVAVSQLRGVYLFRLPYLGYVNGFIRTKTGWFVCIILPATLLLALIIREIIREVSGLLKHR